MHSGIYNRRTFLKYSLKIKNIAVLYFQYLPILVKVLFIVIIVVVGVIVISVTVAVITWWVYKRRKCRKRNGGEWV